MVVAVTGASGLIGPPTVAAFLGTSPEVRALVRRRDAAVPLRALGAKVAVGELEDGETLAALLRGAHTVCHLIGGVNLGDPDAYRVANLGSVRAVLEAARGAGVRRFLLLSYPGVSVGASNAFLHAKASAEELVRGSALEHAIIRCAHVYGPWPSLWFSTTVELGAHRPPIVLGSGRQIVAPVYVGDVAAVLAAADDRAQRVEGTWALEGPERMTSDDVIHELLDEPGSPDHLVEPSPLEVSGLLGRAIDETALEILTAESIGGGPDAGVEFGVALTPLEEGVQRTILEASARMGPGGDGEG